MDYIPRLAEQEIVNWLSQVPAIMLHGPRSIGKTTTAERFAKSKVNLDREAEVAAWKIDPYRLLSGLEEPILIDEWQNYPESITVIKDLANDATKTNRFILTGSVSIMLRHNITSAAGRITHINIHPMTVMEIQGRKHRLFIDWIYTDGLRTEFTCEELSIDDYLNLAVKGGFPRAQQIEQVDLVRFHQDTILTLLNQDLVEVSNHKPVPHKLEDYFTAYAKSSSTMVDHKKIYDSAQISKNTADKYRGILERLLLINEVEAWSKSNNPSINSRRKRFVADSGLMVGALGMSINEIKLDGFIIGKLIETFVAAQLRAELSISKRYPRMHYWRSQDGRNEIDLVIEAEGGIIGIEIKAGIAHRDDANHLFWMQGQLGDRFHTGIVFHTGSMIYRYSDRIAALPISALWSAGN